MLLSLGRRLVGAIPVLLILVLAMFVLRQVAPIDQITALIGENAPPELYERTREELGLNDPLPEQYVRYLGEVVRGDFGDSSVTRRSITTDLSVFLKASAELIALAITLVFVIGTLLGLATAQGWRGAGALRGVMICGASVPPFLGAILGLLLFYRTLGWLPATGRSSVADPPTGPTGFLITDGLLAARLDVVGDALRHLIMPALCMSLVPAVSVGRQFRSSLLATLRSDYVRTAKAKGLSGTRVLMKHAFRNASGPVIALIGLQVAGMFGSTIVVETIFAFPGIGLYISQAIGRGDFTTISAVTIVLGALYVVCSTLIDFVQSLADPRIRF